MVHDTETPTAARQGASPLTLARLARGFSQEELAERAGIARETISRLETGAASPRLTTARALVRVLDFDLELLFPAFAMKDECPADGRPSTQSDPPHPLRGEVGGSP
jgi:transcriptional regulator with XRE-family HTH domain